MSLKIFIQLDRIKELRSFYKYKQYMTILHPKPLKRTDSESEIQTGRTICDNPYVTYIIFKIINIKIYPKQIDNITSDPPHQTDQRDLTISNQEHIREHQPQETKGPTEPHTPV
jgi:hypothetical protein